MFKKIIIVSVSTILYIASAGSAFADQLKVVVDENFPPFSYVKDGKLEGMAIETLKRAAEISGIELHFTSVPFADLESILKSGQVDAIFPLAINPERKAIYDFSEPVLNTGGALFVAVPKQAPDNLQVMKGKIIATPVTGPLANYIRKNSTNVTVVTTKDYEETLKLITSGKVDAGALNLQVGTTFVKEKYPKEITIPSKSFWQLPLALAIPKNTHYDSKILAKLNEGIKIALKKDLSESSADH